MEQHFDTPNPVRDTVSRRAFFRYAAGTTSVLLLAACAPAAPAAPTAKPAESKPAEGASQAPAAPAAKPAAPAAPAPAAPAASPAAAAPAAPAAKPAESPAAAPAAKAAAPAAGAITIGQPSEPATLDPMFAPGTEEYNVVVNVMDGLFTTGEKLAVVPRLAESYRQIDDLNWEFKLRQGIKFHNGEPFNAEAVKVTYERSGDDNLKIRNTWIKDVNVDRIDVVDEYTVRFHTTSPTPHMLARLANDHFIFPPKYLKETDPRTVVRKPIGTGAYIFKEWSAGEKIVLEANPDFWGSPKPSIKTVTYKWIPEHGSRLANLKTGAIEVMHQLDPTGLPEVNADAKLQGVAIAGGRRVYAGFNTKLKPMDDLRVRQAINYAADLESVTKAIFAGATTRMGTWVNPPSENPEVKGYSYDPAKAKQLLQEAGLGQGIKLKWDLEPAGYMKGTEFPQAIAATLRNAGIEVTLNVIERTVAQQQQRDRTTNEMYMRSTAPFFDPGLDFDLLRLNHAGNATGWDDPQFQDLMKKLYTGGTPQERLAWSYQAQARLMEQAPMLFLWKQPEIYGLSKRVQGFKPQGDERFRVWEWSITA